MSFGAIVIRDVDCRRIEVRKKELRSVCGGLKNFSGGCRIALTQRGKLIDKDFAKQSSTFLPVVQILKSLLCRNLKK